MFCNSELCMIGCILLSAVCLSAWPPLPPLPEPESRITWVKVTGVAWPLEHEASHGVAAAVRNRHGGTGKVNAIYVGDGKAAILPEPIPLTMAEVAAAIPPSQRGDAYRLYMVEQRRWWNQQPLYILEEHGAYLNGTLWHRQRSAKDAAYSLARATELGRYVRVLARLARGVRGYDALPLEEFIEYQEARLRAMSVHN